MRKRYAAIIAAVALVGAGTYVATNTDFASWGTLPAQQSPDASWGT